MSEIRFAAQDELTRAMMAAAERALRDEDVHSAELDDGASGISTHEGYSALEPRSRDFNPRQPFVIEGITYRLEDGASGISTLWRDAYFADEDQRGVMVEQFAQSWHPMAVYLAAYRSRVRVAEIMRASE